MNALVAHLTKKVPVIRRLAEERDAAVTERGAANVERDTALTARDAALAERNVALIARDAALAELDKVLAAQQAANAAKSAANGVSPDDVIACIEMILGRTPDAELVQYHLGLGFANRSALGKYMINTGEFQNRYAEAMQKFRPASIFLGDRVLSSTHRGEVIYL
jgi:hypothetical protein